MANLVGVRAIVVGGTSGIGHGIAARLASANASVTIVGRDRVRAEAVLKDLQGRGSGEHRFVACDAQLISNVRDFARDVPAPVDILVLTQGIASIKGRTETSEGLDQKMALHYYSRMAFINELLPQLRAAEQPKVISVLSAGVHAPYKEWKTDPELKTHFSLKTAADAAGYYNDLALDALSRDPANSNIAFIHAAPGFVSTNWGTEMPTLVRWLVRAIQPLGTSLYDCGEYMCRPLLAPATDASATATSASAAPATTARRGVAPGFHLVGPRGLPAKATAEHTDEAVQGIWRHTTEVFQRILQ